MTQGQFKLALADLRADCVDVMLRNGLTFYGVTPGNPETATGCVTLAGTKKSIVLIDEIVALSAGDDR